MLLLALSPAYALTVPLRATLTERVDIGERPSAADTALTAEVYVANPDTGAVFDVSGDELVADLRTASGDGVARFAGDPAGSVRTWAVYYLDSDGNVLGEPDIVDMSFSDADEGGAGGIANAEASYRRITSMTTSAGRDGGFRLSVAVQDAGTAAAWVGIQELRNDGVASDLTDAADLEAMTLGAYATYQGLALDAIVPLDTWSLRVEGELEIEGLSVDAQGTVEGGNELTWNVGFAIPNTRDAFVAVAYEEAIGRVKRRGAAVPRVSLRPADILVGSWDGTTTVSLPGDLRKVETSGYITTAVVGSIAGVAVVSFALKPSSVTVQGTLPARMSSVAVETGYDYVFVPDLGRTWRGIHDTVASGAAVTFPEVHIAVSDTSGGTVSESVCQLSPTARTLEGVSNRDVLVGECLAPEGGGVEIRRLRVAVSETGEAEVTVDLAGATFATERDTGICTARGCDASTTSDLGGSLTISTTSGVTLRTSTLEILETDFELPFVFEEDPSDLEATFEVTLTEPTGAVSWELGDDGTLTSSAGDIIDLEDVDMTGSAAVALKGKGDITASVVRGTPTLALHVDRLTVRAAEARAAAITYASDACARPEFSPMCARN